MSAIVAGFSYKVPDYDYPIPRKMPLMAPEYVDETIKVIKNIEDLRSISDLTGMLTKAL